MSAFDPERTFALFRLVDPADTIACPKHQIPMKRRDFIKVIGGGAAAWPLAAHAQPAKLPTIGFLGTATPSGWSQFVVAFVQRLRDLGWSEGRNVAIEYRWAEGRAERYTEIATEFVRLKVDVIVTAGGAVSDFNSMDKHLRSQSDIYPFEPGPIENIIVCLRKGVDLIAVSAGRKCQHLPEEIIEPRCVAGKEHRSRLDACSLRVHSNDFVFLRQDRDSVDMFSLQILD
jgi:hypothetical protein